MASFLQPTSPYAGINFQADYPAWIKFLFYDLGVRPADISAEPGDRDWHFCGRLFLIGLLKRLDWARPYPTKLKDLLLSQVTGNQQGSQVKQQKTELRAFIRNEMARRHSIEVESTYLAVYSASHEFPLYQEAARAAADAHKYAAMFLIGQPLWKTTPGGLKAHAHERLMQKADLIAIIAGKACIDLFIDEQSELDCLPPWAKT
jgi:hypothetical protein